MLAESIYEYTKGLTLSDLQPLLRSFSYRNHEILNSLIVNFTHHGLNFIRYFRICIGCNTFENLISGHGYNTFVFSITNHWMTLAWPCLAISKETCVETFECIIKYINSNFIKNIPLILIFCCSRLRCGVTIRFSDVTIMTPKRVIESKLLLGIVTQDIRTDSLGICHIYTKDILTIDLW